MSDDRPLMLSPTRLTTWRTCRLKYHFRYVLKRPDPSGDAGRRGKLAHGILERISRYVKGSGNPAIESVVAASICLAADGYNSAEIADVVSVISDEVAPWATGALKNLVEVEWHWEFEAGPGAVVGGYIDRVDMVDGCAVVIDYKTGKNQGEKRLRQNPATWLYMEAARRKWGGYPAVTYKFIRTGKPVRIEFDAMQVAVELLQVLADATAIGEETEYRASEGYWCRWCTYRFVCPAWQATQARRGR